MARFEPALPAPGRSAEFFFKPPTLMACSYASLWPTETHSTSLERSRSLLLKSFLSKSLATLLSYFISVQSTLILIGLRSKGAIFVGPICIFLLSLLRANPNTAATYLPRVETYALIWWKTVDIFCQKIFCPWAVRICTRLSLNTHLLEPVWPILCQIISVSSKLP